MIERIADVVALVVMPIVVVGVINRVKARWAGRRGPPIFQLAYDLRRLVSKSTVLSTTTTPIFRVAPTVVLLGTAAAAVVVPVLGVAPVASFRFDLVWLAYTWGLGRAALVVAAMDTGSAFEGMGAAREATFGALLEPLLFLAVGALFLASGSHTLQGALLLGGGSATVLIKVFAVVAIAVALQVEAARIPVDDPTTHLELTMIHEVMILDHSGRELALLQAAAALKLYVAIALVATLINPWAGDATWIAATANLGLTLAVTIAVALVESLIARLRMRVLPHYIAAGLVAAGLALLAVLATNP